MTTDDRYPKSYSGTWFANSEPVQIRWADGFQLRRHAADGEGSESWIAPGFLDIQVNGYGGVDYSGGDLTVEGFDDVIRALATSGTTRHAPTIITNSQERICSNLSWLASTTRAHVDRARAILGFHVEGPYISPEDGPRGAHDPTFVRDPDWNEVAEWIDAADGLLSLVTLAPERPGAEALIERLRGEGIVVAIGHTAATREDIARAVQAGATLSTHLGNGSHATLPRLKNYVFAQLAEDRLAASLIADGYHLPPDALKVMTRSKPPEQMILVSDVAPLGGTSPGVKHWGNMSVEVHNDGHISLANTPFLAGAGHLLDRAIAQVIKHSGISLSDAIGACTRNVARVLGRSELDFGTAIGGSEPTDVIRFGFELGSDALNVTQVVRAGKMVFDKELSA